MAQVISRALMVTAFCSQAAWTAGKSAGFRRSRTCMVPSAPEAHALDHGCDRLAPKYGGYKARFLSRVLPWDTGRPH